MNLRIGDIDFAESTIAIRRRANDKTDPRVYQPLVKTCERKLIADTKLMFEISDYIMNDRRKIKILTNMTSCLLLIRKENSRATYFIFFISQSGECCSSILLTSRGIDRPQTQTYMELWVFESNRQESGHIRWKRATNPFLSHGMATGFRNFNNL